MRELLLSVLFAAALFGGTPNPVATPFRLYAAFPSTSPETVRSIIKSQVESIMAPTGWTIEWDEPSNPTAPTVSLAIVTFIGNCNVDDLRRFSSRVRKLGRAHVSEGKILNFADVYCDAVGASIADYLAAMDRSRRELLYGRAVARVVAHELYHVLTGEPGHGSEGVAQPFLTAVELLADDLQFALEEVRKLRMKLVPVLFSAYDWPDSFGREEHDGARVFVMSGCGACHGLLAEGTRSGPPLRDAKIPLEPQELTGRIRHSHTAMNGRAQRNKTVWPSERAGDVERLVRYLKNLREWMRASAK